MRPKSGTLNVRNTAQLLALKCEMLGQLSDGHWENSRPDDHWIPWCDAKIEVNPSSVGRNFYARKDSYNFLNRDLLEVVGERMLFQVKLGLLIESAAPDFLEVYTDYHWSFPEGASDYESTKAEAAGKMSTDYWAQQLAIAEGLGIDRELVDEVEAWNGYTMKDLRNDLRDLHDIFKTVRPQGL